MERAANVLAPFAKAATHFSSFVASCDIVSQAIGLPRLLPRQVMGKFDAGSRLPRGGKVLAKCTGTLVAPR